MLLGFCAKLPSSTFPACCSHRLDVATVPTPRGIRHHPSCNMPSYPQGNVWRENNWIAASRVESYSISTSERLSGVCVRRQRLIKTRDVPRVFPFRIPSRFTERMLMSERLTWRLRRPKLVENREIYLLPFPPPRDKIPSSEGTAEAWLDGLSSLEFQFRDGWASNWDLR